MMSSFNQLLRLPILTLLLTALFSATTTLAQEVTCGNITAPANFFNPTPNQSLVTVAIKDCDNPFSLTVDPASPYTLVIEGQQVEDGGTIALPEGRTKNIKIEGESHLDGTDYLLFRHRGDNYVYQSLFAPEPTQIEIEAYAKTFFPTNQEAQFYLNIVDNYLEGGDTNRFFYEESGEDRIDPNTGQTVETRFYSFYYSALDYYEVINKPYIEAGTYTMVMREYELILTQRSLLDKFFDFLIKTAYAQYIFQSNTYAITFTITEEVPEPTGASSVLFLPGIQASRLYSKDFFGLREDQLWEPNANSDVADLRMSISGQSVNDVYTREVIDEVVLPVVGGNIYKGFLGMLEGLVEDKVIKDYEAFAYDWRYSVEDVVLSGTKYENEIRNVINSVEELADDSFTGKVTLIGHSNGGLVAKVLLTELERQGKADLVDKVVFIGTPHLGTPKAIGTVLHGYDQQVLGGAIIDDSTAREVIQNMPGAYSLLPSEKYLELAGEPVINIREGVSTASMQRAFGGSIEGVTEYKNFLNGLEGRINNFSDISNPYKTNPIMLQRALDLHSSLDEWEAPGGVEVFSLVGVGLPTVSKIEYRNVTERINCRGTFFGSVVCDNLVNFVRPYAHFTKYGDGTVTSLSAETVEGNTFYFDFVEFDEGTFSLVDVSHANMTEVDEIQTFVSGIISSSSATLSYISEFKPNFSREYEVVAIDSPVRILKVDSSGKRTGVDIQNGERVVLKEIPGSEYIEFGGTKYLISPKNLEATTYLYGEAYGGYTLTVATLKGGEEQDINTELVNATTTPTMIAQYEFTGEGYTTILTDYDGDGFADMEMTLDGTVIPKLVISFEALRNQITDLKISKARTTPLLILARLAEEAEKLKVHPNIAERISDGFLVRLQNTIKQYARKKWITQDQRDDLIDLINRLIDL